MNNPSSLFAARACAAATLSAAFTLVAVGNAAAQQPYPSKPVRLLVPFAPGGAGDITARTVTQKMGEAMGQQFIIDNRPGAGGVVATEIVAKAEPDGYTLLALNNGHAISAALFKALPYDVKKDFIPVTTIGSVSMALLVPPEAPAKSAKELIAQAKANPGKLNLGTINIGSTPHLAGELFKSAAQIDVVMVPFNATGAVVTALRSNQVQFGFEFITPVLGQIKSGQLRALAVTSKGRSSVLPDVPTVAESGLPGYEAASWNGMAVPAKTPAAIVARLNKEVHAAVGQPEVKKRLQELGVEPYLNTSEATKALLVAEIEKWNGVIDKAKIPRQ
jgi:tripartite-type tricarboxylate transporter receptor subunit TctC